MGVAGDREGYERWRKSRPWWYPLARDPYDAPSFTRENLAAALDQVRQKVAQTSPYFAPLDGARNANEQLRNVSMVDQARNQGDSMAHRPVSSPLPGEPIPGAGDLRGFRAFYGVVVTGPCGARHAMDHSEARALASWLMKTSAEEPT